MGGTFAEVSGAKIVGLLRAATADPNLPRIGAAAARQRRRAIAGGQRRRTRRRRGHAGDRPGAERRDRRGRARRRPLGRLRRRRPHRRDLRRHRYFRAGPHRRHRAGGDRDEQGRRGIRLGRQIAGVEHGRRQEPPADRRRRHFCARHDGRIPRRRARGDRTRAVVLARRRCRPSTPGCPTGSSASPAATMRCRDVDRRSVSRIRAPSATPTTTRSCRWHGTTEGATMTLDEVLGGLFPKGHEVRRMGDRHRRRAWPARAAAAPSRWSVRSTARRSRPRA